MEYLQPMIRIDDSLFVHEWQFMAIGPFMLGDPALITNPKLIVDGSRLLLAVRKEPQDLLLLI